MAGTQVVTLKPTIGADLAISGVIRLDMEPDWGEQSISASLATGPEVRGAVAGAVTQNTRTVVLPLQIKADTDQDYLTAANAISTAASWLGLRRGTIARYVTFPDGTSSEELELEVLECSLEADEGWFEAHRRFSKVTLTFTCQPFWLAPEELIGTVSASSASVTEVPVNTALRGNVPGPARFVTTDNASTARRFEEIGGAFAQDVGSTDYEFLAAEFSLTGAAGTLGGVGSDSAAIGGRSISLSTLTPIWRIMAFANGLPLVGSYRARVRALGATDDATGLVRVSWQPGDGGTWREVGTAELHSTYYDVDIGTLANYTEADTINVKVEVSATNTDTTGTVKLNALTLLPAEVYVVARGVPVTSPISSVAVFDDFTHNSGSALGGTTAPIAPGGSSTWTESGDATPDWTIALFEPRVVRSVTTADADVNSGQYQTIGATTMTDTTVSVDTVSIFNTSSSSTDETRGGLIARYVDTNNWLGLFLRNKKQSSGRLKEIAIYKRVGGTITKLYGVEAPYASGSLLSLSVAASGAVVIAYNFGGGLGGVHYQSLGIDTDLAGAGALNDGKVGIYAAANHTKTALVEMTNFRASANAPTITYVDVVRAGGCGEVTSEGAWSTETDGTNRQAVSSVQGAGLWIPPLTGRLIVKTRSSDSEVEPDTGYSLSTDYDLYARPAFSTLSDSTA